MTTALKHLHSHGLVHRDIKPSNIIFVNGIPKLADIGLVAAVEATLSFVGTEGYLPPEGPGKPPADIYSLGKVLYEMSTGRDRLDFPELPTDLRTVEDRKSYVEFNELIVKACDHDLGRRYQTADQVHQDLVHLQAGKSLKRSRLMEKRLALLTKLSVVVIVVTALLAAAYFYQQFQTREARRLAQAEAFQRTRAEGFLNTAQLKEAEHFFEDGEGGKGAAYLARMLRQTPTNQIAAARLMSALTDRSFALPLRSFKHSEDVRGWDFSPDGLRLLTWSGSGSNSVVQIWDTGTAEVIGKPMRHDSDVTESRFSPDGRFVATAFKDGTARMWAVATGEPITGPLTHDKHPNGNPTEVRQVLFSPDSQTLLTVAGLKTQLWKVPSGEPIMSMESDGRSRTQFSPDGQRILTPPADGRTAKVWDAKTGKLQFVIRTDSNGTRPYSAPQFSPDGNRIAADGGNEVYVWSATTGELLLELHHDAEVGWVNFSPDGLRIVTRDFNRSARVWDARTGQSLLPPLIHGEGGKAQFDSTGERILTDAFPRARIWDSRTGRPLTEWLTEIEDAQFTPNGLQVLGKDPADRLVGEKTLILWDVRPSQALNVVLRHKDPVPSAKFSSNGEKVVIATGGHVFRQWLPRVEGEAVVYDARTGELVAPRIKVPGGVQYAEFSPDGRKIVTASNSGQARIWDAETSTPIGEVLKHGGAIRRARFSSDGQKIVTASEDKTARVWDAQTGQPLTDPLVHTNEVSSAAFSPDGRWVLTVCRHMNAPVLIWDAETGQVRSELPHGETILEAGFSPDGKRIVTASGHRTAQLWDSQTGKAMGQPMEHQDEVWFARFSPDGRLVITGAFDQTARIWDAWTGKPMTGRLVHQGPVSYVEFSHDSRRVVTASTDNTARVWDAQTGRPLTEPFRHDGWIGHAEFSPDGTRLITASADGTARIWELPPAEVSLPAWLLDLAEGVVGQRLGDQEVPQRVSPAQFLALKERLLESQETNRYTAWAKWLVADRSPRKTSPSSGVTGSQHLDRLIRWNPPSSNLPGRDSVRALREALHLGPDNALAMARLARELLIAEARRHPQKIKEAEFLSARALKLNPKEPEVWRAKAEILEHAGRLEEALEAIDRAVALNTDAPLLWNEKGRLLEKVQRDVDALHAYSKAVALASAASQDDTKLLEAGLLARAKVLKRWGREKESAADNLRARGIAPRDSQTKPALIDLSSHYNRSLSDGILGSQSTMLSNNLAFLPQGVQVLAGISYDIRGVKRVGRTRESANEVTEVTGIRVDQECRQLHFLHAADCVNESPRKRLGNYTVEYMDGQKAVIPLEINRSLGWLWAVAVSVGDAEVAWKGINDESLDKGYHIRLFKLSWSNPRPEARIKSIGLEYLKPADDAEVRSLFEVICLIAITAQSEPTPAITQQPQPQTVAEGENVVFRVEAVSELPLAYQWQLNGADLPGATNATLSLKAVTRHNAGTYTAHVRNAIEDSLLGLTSDPAPLVVKAGRSSFGALRREMFLNLGVTNRLAELTNHVRFPNDPDTVDLVHQFETPSHVADNYGVRLTGYLVPPKTGEYRFYLCSDDEGALFLSTSESSANKRRIAHEPEWNRDRLWTASHLRPKRENVSKAIHLEAGRHYYIEALMKEGKVFDNLAVTWQMPGEPPPENFALPIPGTYLAVPAEWPKAAPTPLVSGQKDPERP